MPLTQIQSIVSRLSQAEDAFVNSKDSGNDGKQEADFRKLRSELLLAGLKDLAGHGGLNIRELAVKRFEPVPLIITMAPAPEEPARPSFGPKLAEMLNACRKDSWPGSEDQFLQPVKPSDHQCMRSERMIRGLLTKVALDQCNGTPDELLDPITPAEMAAFAFPGGLLSGQGRADTGLEGSPGL